MDFGMLVIAVQVLQKHLDDQPIIPGKEPDTKPADRCPYGFEYDRDKQACVRARLGGF